MPPHSRDEEERSSHKHRSRNPRSRSRSPRPDDSHRHHHRRHRSPPAPKPVALPYKAQKLSKHKYEEYKPLFQSYLDIQKQLNLDELDDREARGRWKSFVSRWNRGDLARSWYDPSMLKTAQETISSYRAQSSDREPPLRGATRASPEYGTEKAEELQSDDDDFGPAPPKDMGSWRTGPAVPRLDDLALRDEQRQEDRNRDHANYVDDIRFERKQDRKAQKENLDELVPRADPGSRERQLEKKREKTTVVSDFRDAKEGGDVDVGEADLMGDDGIEGYKKQKVNMERKKTERELRREEIMRARDAERDERLAERRAKEEHTMEYFKQIAKERFG
ncbi:hypothetical protein K504DRAFT_479971 [Pleomassaria siparia CBS 279.74]|uniref:Uncharacterized protein n=1 Tax=Pleomassaria siparia CBS 279.74 TaxID=1314801 RepID=A0A6G1KHF8_9PLEO|nr:hypothetical protein K504DRAFT_479971 [Pleomassaria siparia CBS 279.74]